MCVKWCVACFPGKTSLCFRSWFVCFCCCARAFWCCFVDSVRTPCSVYACPRLVFSGSDNVSAWAPFFLVASIAPTATFEWILSSPVVCLHGVIALVIAASWRCCLIAGCSLTLKSSFNCLRLALFSCKDIEDIPEPAVVIWFPSEYRMVGSFIFPNATTLSAATHPS